MRIVPIESKRIWLISVLKGSSTKIVCGAGAAGESSGLISRSIATASSPTVSGGMCDEKDGESVSDPVYSG